MKDRSEKKDGKNSLESDQVKTKTHPDGEWGWCVVMAAFLTQFVVVGLQNSAGVIFNELVQKFNRPRGETGKNHPHRLHLKFLIPIHKIILNKNKICNCKNRIQLSINC